MRILVFSHEYPPVGGGGGQVARDLGAGLAARGHQVKLITAHWGGLPQLEVQQGVEIHRLKSGRSQPFRAGLGAMAGYDWAAFWYGLRLARQWQPDVLHAHFAVPAGAVALALHRLTGIPYALTAHLGDVPGGTPEKTGRWFRLIYPLTPPVWRNAAQVAAVSGFTRQLAMKSYNVPVRVIFNGVDTHALNPGEIVSGNPPRLVFAGRFMPQKNPLQVVRTLAALRDLPWTCVMAGDGPLRQAVIAEIEREGLTERFTLPGWVETAQVLEYFANSDILLMPSLSEGLPVVGVQALAYGLALVVSRIGGWSDLVSSGENGFMLEKEDAPGFEEALRGLLTNPAQLLAFRRASRERAADFDLKKIVTQYEELLAAAAVVRGSKA